MKTLQNWVGFAIKTDLLLSVFDFFLGLLERNYSMFHGVIDSSVMNVNSKNHKHSKMSRTWIFKKSCDSVN